MKMNHRHVNSRSKLNKISGSVLIETALVTPILIVFALWFWENSSYNRAMIRLNHILHSHAIALQGGLGGRGLQGRVDQMPTLEVAQQAIRLLNQDSTAATGAGAGRTIMAWRILNDITSQRLPVRLESITLQFCKIPGGADIRSPSYFGTIKIDADYIPKTVSFMQSSSFNIEETVRVIGIKEAVVNNC